MLFTIWLPCMYILHFMFTIEVTKDQIDSNHLYGLGDRKFKSIFVTSGFADVNSSIFK